MTEYEFSAQHNQTFDALSGALRRFAIMIGLFSVLMAIYGIAGAMKANFNVRNIVLLILGGAVGLVAAYLFTRPLDNFQKITTTSGSDMTELGHALGDLNTAHNMLRAIAAVFVAVKVVGFFLLRTSS